MLTDGLSTFLKGKCAQTLSEYDFEFLEELALSDVLRKATELSPGKHPLAFTIEMMDAARGSPVLESISSAFDRHALKNNMVLSRKTAAESFLWFLKLQLLSVIKACFLLFARSPSLIYFE